MGRLLQVALACWLCAAAPTGLAAALEAALNGFVLEQPLVPADEILHGGPPRDGIPALDAPRFVAAAQMRELRDDDRVLGLELHGEAKAYPVRILDYHELVNDRFGEQPVLISYCPLCGTGMAFESSAAGRTLDFGVSGLLYNSDVLMYDRQTESLWSQIARRAVNGPLKGETLAMLPLQHLTWEQWRARYPDSRVLSFDTGHRRDYGETPYVGYRDSARTYFPVNHSDKRYHPKEVVIGVEIGGVYKAYPFEELGKVSSPLRDTIGGEPVRIDFDAERRTALVFGADDALIPHLSSYWFAWVGFHPQTQVFRSDP